MQMIKMPSHASGHHISCVNCLCGKMADQPDQLATTAVCRLDQVWTGAEQAVLLRMPIAPRDADAQLGNTNA